MEQNTDNKTGEADSQQSVVRRLGRFSLSAKLLHTNWKEALVVMRDVVVVRAESRWEKDCIDYVALSDHFEAVGVGAEPPEYQATLTYHKNGEITVEWKRSDAWRREYLTRPKLKRQTP